jgi:hypothetical protein
MEAGQVVVGIGPVDPEDVLRVARGGHGVRLPEPGGARGGADVAVQHPLQTTPIAVPWTAASSGLGDAHTMHTRS